MLVLVVTCGTLSWPASLLTSRRTLCILGLLIDRLFDSLIIDSLMCYHVMSKYKVRQILDAGVVGNSRSRHVLRFGGRARRPRHGARDRADAQIARCTIGHSRRVSTI